MDDYELLKQRMGALSFAIFLFGVAALFLADAIFPAILPLIWLSLIPTVLAEQGGKYGLWILAQVGIWLGGLPLLLEMGMFFPGVLVLAGMSALLVAIAPPDKLDKEHQEWVRRLKEGEVEKPKRQQTRGEFPLPPAAYEDEDDVEDDEPEDEILYSARAERRHK